MPHRLRAGALDLVRVRTDMCDELLDAAISSYPELHRWMTWAAQPPTREGILSFLSAAESHFDKGVAWTFALVERSTEAIVGVSDLRSLGEARRVEIGYWVRTDRTRRGYASSAAGALTAAAFEFLASERVQIRMDKANTPSASVPPKIGFTLLGETSRPIETPGHSGRQLIWIKECEARDTLALI